MNIITQTFLEILKDMDGEYHFNPLIKCRDKDDARRLAWLTHQRFMQNEENAGFTQEGALNSLEGDFLTDISQFDVVVTMSGDGKYRVVYRIITLELRVDVTC